MTESISVEQSFASHQGLSSQQSSRRLKEKADPGTTHALAY
jgi:hypothetical protein